jgi:hypothetical protein
LDPELQEVYVVDCFANEERVSRKEDDGLEGLGMVIEGRTAGKGIDDHVNAFDFGPCEVRVLRIERRNLSESCLA